MGTLGTGYFSEAWGLNNLGQVVGWSYTNGGGLIGVHGSLYSEGEGLVDLTPESDNGSALDINDAGQVTGYKTAFGGYHAFRWQQGTFTDLGVLPALGLQNLGGAGEHNVAWGINASGTVVGTRGQSMPRAVLYDDAGGLRDLDTLIDPSLGWVPLGANDINDAGEIAGYGFNNLTGQTHAVRLRPTTTPPPRLHPELPALDQHRIPDQEPGSADQCLPQGQGHGRGRERNPHFWRPRRRHVDSAGRHPARPVGVDGLGRRGAVRHPGPARHLHLAGREHRAVAPHVRSRPQRAARERHHPQEIARAGVRHPEMVATQKGVVTWRRG